MKFFILLIFFFIYTIYPQESEKFPDFLIKENEYLSTFPDTNYIFELSESDFIICKKNPKIKKDIPASNKEFKMDFNNQTFLEIGEFNNYLIEYYLKTNDIHSTIKGFENGYHFDPLFFSFLYNLGKLYFIKKDYKKSIYYFYKTLYFFPEYSRIHFYLGKNYYLINDNLKGELHFKKSFQLNPEQVEYWIDYIKILQDKQLISKAYYYLKEGEKRFYNNVFFMIFKANLHIQQNQFLKAIQILDKIPLEKINEYEQLELKYTKFLLYEKTNNLEKALNEINDILNTRNLYFFNKYSKELLNSQKERMESLLKK